MSSSFFVPLRHGTSCNCPQTLGYSRVRRLWPGSWPLVASQPGIKQFRQYLESTIVWLNLPLYHRFQDFALSFRAKRAWQSESKHLKRFKGHVASDHGWLVKLWHVMTRDIVKTASCRRGCQPGMSRSEVGNHKQPRSKKTVPKLILTFRTKDLVDLGFGGFRSNLIWRWGWVFLNERGFSLKFSSRGIAANYFFMETNKLVGSNSNVILRRQTCSQRSITSDCRKQTPSAIVDSWYCLITVGCGHGGCAETKGALVVKKIYKDWWVSVFEFHVL